MGMLETLLTVLIGSGGCGVLGWILSARSTRRKAAAEAGIQEAEAMIKDIEADEKQVQYLKSGMEDAYRQLNALQTVIDELRTKLLEAKRKIGDLELRILEEERLRKIAQYNECTRDCSDRQPPRSGRPVSVQRRNEEDFFKE